MKCLEFAASGKHVNLVLRNSNLEKYIGSFEGIRGAQNITLVENVISYHFYITFLHQSQPREQIRKRQPVSALKHCVDQRHSRHSPIRSRHSMPIDNITKSKNMHPHIRMRFVTPNLQLTGVL